MVDDQGGPAGVLDDLARKLVEPLAQDSVADGTLIGAVERLHIGVQRR